MRCLAIGLLFLATVASAGEAPPVADPAAQAQAMNSRWISCRVTARRGTSPRSLDVTVYTSLMQRDTRSNDVDYIHAFSAYVEQTYGVHSAAECVTTSSEAQAQENLDFWTTNKANPSQIQVVKTGWTYQAPGG